MTTMTITRGLNLQEVRRLVGEMRKVEVEHITPNKYPNTTTFYNGAIDELIIDEDGNVFILPEGAEAVMLPSVAV